MLVDVRGRGNSEGAFEPFANEGRDGYDVVEWLARQPWCNGKVAMWGGSYAGFDQWSTLKELPPHLTTIVPAAAAAAGKDFPFFKNIFGTYDIQWLTFTSGRTGNAKLFGDSKFWTSKFRELYTEHRPYSELDRISANTSTVFQKWIQHPEPDPYWDAMYPTPEQFSKMAIPILTITGHYDADQTGAMSYYRDHMRHGNAEAKDRHYLIVGPWDHAGTRTPTKEVGGVKFGDASMLDLNKLHKDWFDWTMKGGAKPAFLKSRVAYYVSGSDEWKYSGSLEAVAPATKKLFLDSAGGQANDAYHSGWLKTTKPEVSAPDRYVYDPLDIRPSELEATNDTNCQLDQTEPMSLLGNGVLYHSDPFLEATEVSGYVKFSVWMAMDVPDTDFEVSLYELLSDGTSIPLTGDMIRARYRESLRQAKLVTPGEVTRYDFSGFTFFSRRIAKGSRLRLMLRCPNSAQLEKNYNSGGIVATESGKDARTAHVTVYHDAQHPSILELPMMR